MAMDEDFQEEPWYQELDQKDQKLVGTLRAAQQNQGNMQPLPSNIEEYDHNTQWMVNANRLS